MARCSSVGIANDNAVYAKAQTRPSATDRHSPRHSVSSRRSVGHIGRSGGSTCDTPANRLAERDHYRRRIPDRLPEQPTRYTAEPLGGRRSGQRSIALASRYWLGGVLHAAQLRQPGQLCERLLLELADALARQPDLAAHCLEQHRLTAAEPVAKLDDAARARRQPCQRALERLVSHALANGLRHVLTGGVGDHVAQLGVALVAGRPLQRDGLQA